MGEDVSSQHLEVKIIEIFIIKEFLLGLIYLITMSGLVEEVHSSLKKTTQILEQEIHVEDDNRRILKLSHLIRDIDRLQPLKACGLFRKGP